MLGRERRRVSGGIAEIENAFRKLKRAARHATAANHAVERWHVSCTPMSTAFAVELKQAIGGTMKKLALATLVAMSFGAAAFAQQSTQQSGRQSAQQPRQQQSQSAQPRGGDRTDQVAFETADKNKDGVINREEGNDIAGFDFSRADTNNDRQLSRQEYQAAMATSTQRGDGERGPRSGDRTAQVSFETADKNSDGKVSREEANDIPGFNFSSADVNDDASLSRQEFQTAMAGSQPRG
jgi:Ca2+-binding EF-hand superfamily protein